MSWVFAVEGQTLPLCYSRWPVMHFKSLGSYWTSKFSTIPLLHCWKLNQANKFLRIHFSHCWNLIFCYHSLSKTHFAWVAKIKIRRIEEQHCTMVSTLAYGPSCPRFDSQHSWIFFQREKCQCCWDKSKVLTRGKWTLTWKCLSNTSSICWYYKQGEKQKLVVFHKKRF